MNKKINDFQSHKIVISIVIFSQLISVIFLLTPPLSLSPFPLKNIRQQINVTNIHAKKNPDDQT